MSYFNVDSHLIKEIFESVGDCPYTEVSLNHAGGGLIFQTPLGYLYSHETRDGSKLNIYRESFGWVSCAKDDDYSSHKEFIAACKKLYQDCIEWLLLSNPELYPNLTDRLIRRLLGEKLNISKYQIQSDYTMLPSHAEKCELIGDTGYRLLNY